MPLLEIIDFEYYSIDLDIVFVSFYKTEILVFVVFNP